MLTTFLNREIHESLQWNTVDSLLRFIRDSQVIHESTRESTRDSQGPKETTHQIHELKRQKWSPDVGLSFHRIKSEFWWVFTLGPYESQKWFKWLSLNFNESWDEMTCNDMKWISNLNSDSCHVIACHSVSSDLAWISSRDSLQILKWINSESLMNHEMNHS